MKTKCIPNQSVQRLLARVLGALLFAVAIAASPLAFAQEKNEVTVNLVAKRVVVTEGRQSLESAPSVKPGDVIQYDAVYRNASNRAVGNLQATVPIPQHLVFVAESIKPAGALASIDGKTFLPMPLTREVKSADGTMEKQAVPLGEYRALGWTIAELPAGATTTVSLRARVLANTAAK